MSLADGPLPSTSGTGLADRGVTVRLIAWVVCLSVCDAGVLWLNA